MSFAVAYAAAIAFLPGVPFAAADSARYAISEAIAAAPTSVAVDVLQTQAKMPDEMQSQLQQQPLPQPTTADHLLLFFFHEN
jgi:hypothetical protein